MTVPRFCRHPTNKLAPRALLAAIQYQNDRGLTIAANTFHFLRRRLGLLRLRLSFASRRWVRAEECLPFRCNICGSTSVAPHSELCSREARSCVHCGSNQRFRAITHALARSLFDQDLALPDIAPAPHITGLGLSDEELYARVLREKFCYHNTYYHRPPYLDITAVDASMSSSVDFVIASDVFEHVLSPVDKAFRGLYQLLRPGGVAILTVPYTQESDTREHYPQLHEFRIEREQNDWVLLNRTVDGEQQCFRNPVFHGGLGKTLEIRVFSEIALSRHLREAGFTGISKLDDSFGPFGILRESAGNAVFVAHKAATAEP